MDAVPSGLPAAAATRGSQPACSMARSSRSRGHCSGGPAVPPAAIAVASIRLGACGDSFSGSASATAATRPAAIDRTSSGSVEEERAWQRTTPTPDMASRAWTWGASPSRPSTQAVRNPSCVDRPGDSDQALASDKVEPSS